jgi:uncharacterized protein HemX
MDTFNLNQMPPVQNDMDKKSAGPLVAVIIILALIIVGGLYFLKQRSSQQVYVPAPVQAPATDSITDSLNKQGSSDNLNSIEADLNATDVSNLDQGAAAVEAQLQ